MLSSSTALLNGVLTKDLRTRAPYVVSRMGLEQEDLGGEITVGVGAADTGARAASGFAAPLSAFVLEHEL